MNTTTSSAGASHPYDADVITYLQLTDQIEALEVQRHIIKKRLRDLGVGKHPSINGVVVSVTPPARRFNLDKAWQLLTAEQQQVCTSPDASKVKRQLSGELLDLCMDPGSGAGSVSVK